LKTIHFFLDFDGTITTADVVDLVLEKFGAPEWREVERQWAAGKIGSRECLTKQIALVEATPEKLSQLVSKVKLDPGFVSFLQRAEELGVLVTIVSDGFDLMIEQVLKENLASKNGYLKALPIFSNRLLPSGRGFRAVFPSASPCEHGCANCKAAVIKKLTSPDDVIVFVGDGLSDRYAAKKAHVTFAKGKLLEWCNASKVDCIPYGDFKKIREWLSENHALLQRAHFK
jgi:2,3-diketo-5-methylthio-1-phosphopentane phosphatase